MFEYNIELKCYNLKTNPEKKFTEEFLNDCISTIKPIRLIEEFVNFVNGNGNISFSLEDRV